MLLIIAHHYDTEAQWLHHTLQQAEEGSSLLLVPEALGIDYSITLILNNNGRHEASVFVYATQQRFYSSSFTYVLNRLGYIQPLAWKHSGKVEKEYAASEMNAFFSAFIHALPCPVSLPVYNGALGADPETALQWIRILNKQGNLKINTELINDGAAWQQLLSTTEPWNIFRIMIAGNTLLQPDRQDTFPEPSVWDVINKNKTGTEMIEFVFVSIGGSLSLVQVSHCPSLSLYAGNFISFIQQLLKQKHHANPNGHTQRKALAATG